MHAAHAADLEEISEYLKERHPPYWQPTIRRLYQAIRSLKEGPNQGRLGREEGTRVLPFPPLPYIAIYRVKEGTVEILRIYQRCARSLLIRVLPRAQADRHDYFRMSCGFPDQFTHSRMG
jgi:toxin ParE1/3/4